MCTHIRACTHPMLIQISAFLCRMESKPINMVSKTLLNPTATCSPDLISHSPLLHLLPSLILPQNHLTFLTISYRSQAQIQCFCALLLLHVMWIPYPPSRFFLTLHELVQISWWPIPMASDGISDTFSCEQAQKKLLCSCAFLTAW